MDTARSLSRSRIARKASEPSGIRTLAALLCRLIIPASAPGRTWIVQYDPAHPADTIVAVVLQAASGDSILIGTGTYTEHIPVEGKELTLIGTGGAEQTILDGGQPIEGREANILYTNAPGGVRSLWLRGLTFQHGSTGPTWSAGGAILLSSSAGMAALNVQECRFVENHITLLGMCRDGAIFAYYPGQANISDCLFRNNSVSSVNGFGGAIATDGGAVTISNCVFEFGDAAHQGGAVYSSHGSSMTIHGCTFTYQANGGDLFDVVDGCIDNTDIRHCQFLSPDWCPYIHVKLYGCTIEYHPRSLVFEDNMIWNRRCLPGHEQGGVEASGVDVTAAGNTLVGADFYCVTTGPCTLERNIIDHGYITLGAMGGGRLSCNDFWSTTMSMNPVIPGANDISADPLFCGLDQGNLQIAHQSPCAAGHSPPGCGRIGALDEGCDVPAGACCVAGDSCVFTTPQQCSDQGGSHLGDGSSCDPNPCALIPVQTMTWGRIKARFRDAGR